MPANLYRGQDANDVATLRREVRRQPVLRRDRDEAAAGGHDDNDGDRPRRPRRRRRHRRRPPAKQVFASAGCGGCHTLKDAGSSGNVGPNLDQLKPSQATVAQQVENGGGADAGVQGPAHARADQGGRDVRLERRRQVADA